MTGSEIIIIVAVALFVLWVFWKFGRFFVSPIEEEAESRAKQPKAQKAQKAIAPPKRGLKIPARITYQGGSEPGLTRDILISGISAGFDREAGQKTELIAAFCMTRGGNRIFRADRISELIDTETGEVVADPAKWVKEAVEVKTQQRRRDAAARAKAARAAKKAAAQVPEGDTQAVWGNRE